jgi:thiamine kinase-like enzyme
MRIALNDIDKWELARFVGDEYGFQISDLHVGPQGEDSYSYIGEMKNGRKCFIRLQEKQSSSFENSMAATLVLRRKTGLWQIVSPYQSNRGLACSHFLGYTVAIFPHIRGRTLHEAGRSSSDIAKAARLMAKIHNTSLKGFSGLKKERFNNPFKRNILTMSREARRSSAKDDKYQKKARRLVKAESTTIISALNEIARLRGRIRHLNLKQVITHGDASSANYIKDGRGRLHLVDWGDIGIGPVERDLFHFSGTSLEEFLKDYRRIRGSLSLSIDVFAFYFYRWALQEISDFGTRIFYERTNPREKQHAWNELQDYVPVPHNEISRHLTRINSVIGR